MTYVEGPDVTGPRACRHVPARILFSQAVVGVKLWGVRLRACYSIANSNCRFMLAKLNTDPEGASFMGCILYKDPTWGESTV